MIETSINASCLERGRTGNLHAIFEGFNIGPHRSQTVGHKLYAIALLHSKLFGSSNDANAFTLGRENGQDGNFIDQSRNQRAINHERLEMRLSADYHVCHRFTKFASQFTHFERNGTLLENIKNAGSSGIDA